MRAILLPFPFLSLALPLHAELPPDAALLQAQHAAKTVELNQKYANELEKLQKRAMQDGNLTAANEIEKEIARVIPNPLADAGPKLDGKWRVNESLTRTIEGKIMTDEKGGKHSWKFENGVITIEWGKNWEKLNYDPKTPDVLKGVNDIGGVYIYKRLRSNANTLQAPKE